MAQPLPGDIFSVGQVLNNTYIIDKILGRGGTGEVYRARNKITERLVAVKALNRQFSGNADYIELMKREEEMRAIQHPAVVRYTECSMSDDGHVFLVMDYVEGPALSEVMTERRMDPRELLIIGHGVAEGLVATHAQGIIHRDLSPDNIILRHGDPTKATIIDFGIAKDTAVGARTIVGSDFAGKYEYSAPEQLEGHVDPKSDLYAVGATLLAAWRGETPFLGATPGEIIRRKQAPLSTDGVPEPLRNVIDRLTAPDPAERPNDAAALVEQIGSLLRPDDDKAAKSTKKPKRSGFISLIAGGAVVAGLVAAWLGGAFDRLVTPPLPLAEPYALDLRFESGAAPVLTGNAPDSETAELFRSAVAQSLGEPPAGEMTLARGLPDEDWASEVGALMQQIRGLESGQLSVKDRNADLTGLAVSASAKSAITDSISQFATANSWRIITSLSAGPLSLSSDSLRDGLSDLEDCGPLSLEGASEGNFGIADPITVTGNFAHADSAAAVTARLAPLVGDRPVTLATQTLNPELCAIRQSLIAAPTNIVTLALTNGETGARNLSGVFTTGQNPVVDVLIPESYGGSAIWVMAVNPDGSVFHVVPNIYNEESQISSLATPTDGIYRIRALHTIEEFTNNNKKLAIRVTDEDYDKSEIIAILSRTPLFAGRRPTTESVASTVQALNTILAGNPDNILGVASAIIDARP